jgi:hypothetical protein
MTFWAEYHGGFKGFSPNEFFEWEDSHPLCSNALSPSGSVMITITITITMCWYIFSVSRATKTLVDNDDKTAVLRRRNANSAAITLVPSRGHIIRATRSHDLPEAILADQGAPRDHSEISVRRTD